MIDFKGKVALVTGASRGIGNAIAQTIAQHGGIVIGSATNENGAHKITELLKPYNGHGVALDFRSVDLQAHIASIVNDIEKQFSKIDILVNNAGITQNTLLVRMQEDQWDDMINVNLKAMFLLTKQIVRGMMSNRSGRIINLSSVVAFTGNPGQTSYVSSKAAVIGFTKSLAQEVGSRGITVNAVAPGFIETDMTDAHVSAELKSKLLERIPLKKMGGVNDIANAVLFLASDMASYITGSTIHVNGGMY